MTRHLVSAHIVGMMLIDPPEPKTIRFHPVSVYKDKCFLKRAKEPLMTTNGSLIRCPLEGAVQQ